MTHVAVIYDPRKEKKPDDFVGGWSQLPPPVYPLSIQIPENGEFVRATPTKGRGGAEIIDSYFNQKFKTVFLRPSTNLDVNSQDWEFCLRDSMVQWRLSVGSLEVVEPDEEALKREPSSIGFRMYSLQNALKLVAATKDLITLRQWASLEERKPVIEAIAKQEEAIRSHLRKLQEN